MLLQLIQFYGYKTLNWYIILQFIHFQWISSEFLIFANPVAVKWYIFMAFIWAAIYIIYLYWLFVFFSVKCSGHSVIFFSWIICLLIYWNSLYILRIQSLFAICIASFLSLWLVFTFCKVSFEELWTPYRAYISFHSFDKVRFISHIVYGYAFVLSNISLPWSYKDIFYFILRVSGFCFYSYVFNLFRREFDIWYDGRGPVSHFSMWIPNFQALFDEFFLLVNDLQCHRSLTASFQRCGGFSLSSLFIMFHWSIFFILADTVLITICIIMSLKRWWKKSLHLIPREEVLEEILAIPGFLHFHLSFRVNILKKKKKKPISFGFWLGLHWIYNQLEENWHLSVLSLS